MSLEGGDRSSETLGIVDPAAVEGTRATGLDIPTAPRRRHARRSSRRRPPGSTPASPAPAPRGPPPDRELRAVALEQFDDLPPEKRAIHAEFEDVAAAQGRRELPEQGAQKRSAPSHRGRCRAGSAPAAPARSAPRTP